jgi:hypothetical protein
MVSDTTVGTDIIGTTDGTVGIIMDFIITTSTVATVHTHMEVVLEVVSIAHTTATTIMHIVHLLIGEEMVLHLTIFKMQILQT